jgi:hypothetical protein
LLDDVEKYFKSAPPLSEEKAHASLTTIFTRVARDFPLISSVSNIAKRLSKDLRDKISDVHTDILSAAKRATKNERKAQD